MIVDNRGDASHESQSCRHVEMKMEGLGKPERTNSRQKKKRIKERTNDLKQRDRCRGMESEPGKRGCWR